MLHFKIFIVSLIFMFFLYRVFINIFTRKVIKIKKQGHLGLFFAYQQRIILNSRQYLENITAYIIMFKLNSELIRDLQKVPYIIETVVLSTAL